MQNFKTMKQAIASKLIKVTKDKIQVLEDCSYLVETKDKNFVTINSGKKTITCFVNFILEFDEETRVLININDVLEPSYNFYEEVSEGYLCYLNKDSYLFSSNLFPTSKNNSNNMLTYFLNGKLGSDGKIRYEDVYTTFKNVMEKSGLPKLESLSYELLVAETIRNEKDPTLPFRLEASPIKQYGFTTVKLKDIGKSVSAISALNSEDITDSLSQIVLNSKNKKDSIITPVEKIMLNKY